MFSRLPRTGWARTTVAEEFGTGMYQPRMVAPDSLENSTASAGRSDGGSPTLPFAGAASALPRHQIAANPNTMTTPIEMEIAKTARRRERTRCIELNCGV